MPRYQEFNPGLLTAITFPFLFGVMFGDILHGLCLFLFALYLCWRKPVLRQNRQLRPLLEFRFMLLMMGVFSFYSGLIYNEFAGMCLRLFSSCYRDDGTQYVLMSGCTYPLGLDPRWQGQLSFVNSLKMKLSVILAYTHMSMGICIMALNHAFNKHSLGVVAKFIPQVLFLSCTFGYMDFLILIKWFSVYEDSPPSVINTMITMVLRFGAVEEGTEMYGGQAVLQCVLAIVAILCVPVMWYPHIARARSRKLRIDIE